MPVNNTQLNSFFNTGTDLYSVTVADQNGNNIPLGKIASFSAKPSKGMTEIKPINTGGVYSHKQHFNFWTGEIMIYRQDNTLDNLEYAQEQAYQNGGQQLYYSINTLVQNQDGSVDEWTYTQALLSIDTAGEWKEDDSVTIKIEFTAEQRTSNSAS